ncbi:hypothetical protein K488DRAFT_90202 [Vararia minispora EC-137]|uniref:Uncharacterized protein n=1 Tax=Vararia minispora EC-137 TaxID=1314806 RepID=A0ACB8Q863_9AGAM|nr:hypothetical protein K488DRAFT_90202 [Vararia minispora EC-137]
MQSQKASSEAFRADGFARQTHTEQVNLGQQYAQCATEQACADFVKSNATWWCELARLPYFDLCTMIVIDPMHNLLLGLVKHHFYQIWIQGKVLRKMKELRRLHVVLHDIPQIRDEYLDDDPEVIHNLRHGNLKAAMEWRKAAQQAARKKREEQLAAARPSCRDNKEDKDGDLRRGPRLHPNDPKNFLRLTSALNILLSQTIDDASIDAAGGIESQLSLQSVNEAMPTELYHIVLQYFSERNTGPVPVIPHTSIRDSGIPLLPKVTFYSYAVLSQRRYWATSHTNNRANSMVLVSLGDNRIGVGELLRIFHIWQPPLTPDTGYALRWMRWLIPAQVQVDAGSAWNAVYNSDSRIRIWEYDQANSETDALIPIGSIQSHVILTTAVISGSLKWLTIPVNKNVRGH